jgi:hypothetical protein
MSSLQEQATQNFYQWEIRGRGHIHGAKPVDIEPPYIPFTRTNMHATNPTDDGRVPSLWDTIVELIESPKEKVHLETASSKPSELTPLGRQESLHCVVFSFPKGSDISISLMQEVLNLMVFSEQTISFEILAQNGILRFQFVASEYDLNRIQKHFEAFFSAVLFELKDIHNMGFDLDKTIAIADYGLEHEFMLPIAVNDSLSIDPLTSIVATLGSLDIYGTGLLQILFKGVTAPWSGDMQFAVSDGRGGSFFENALDFVSVTQEKVRHPLFAVVVRTATQGSSDEHSAYLAQELARSITAISQSEYNRLIPLSNEGYAYGDHVSNIYHRQSNRLGFIANTKELATLVHYPNNTVVHTKLGAFARRTKILSDISKIGISIGINTHRGTEQLVRLDSETRLSHTHILGATGVGKSTLIAHMILQDIVNGLGCALCDPHGDVIDDVLKRIPQNRIKDVILIDPSDTDFPIGFNLLEAKTEAEKIVLSSDLVASFKRHATAWGDNIQAVLQNAINTILESTRGGTLIELKRFLIEESFRNEYLTSVDDPSLHYYWQNEYPMVRKGIAPLLTRIDTFLRPKIVRYMLAQKNSDPNK